MIERKNELRKFATEMSESRAPRMGFKGFKVKERKPNGELVLCCRDQQYGVGVPVVFDGEPQLAVQGLHYCSQLCDVFDHYPVAPDTVYGRVSDTGATVGNAHLCSTNCLTLVELLNEEVDCGTTSGVSHGKCYFRNGSIVKQRGPGFTRWYHNGELHREDGPALELDNGHMQWYQHGKRHRIDGPAIESTWYDHEPKEWYFEGLRHRENGPAVVQTGGREEWFRHGVLHREDGPALVRSDGSKFWYLNGKLHREDGPAVEHSDGSTAWYWKGEPVFQKAPAS